MAIRVVHLLENQAVMGRILSLLKKLEMAMRRKVAVGKKPETAMGRILSLLKKLAMAVGKKPETAMGRILSLLKKLAIAMGIQ
jgi:hypothetical protein